MGPQSGDLGAVRRTELIFDALAARRGPPREAVPEASADLVAGLLAALAADVDQDLPTGPRLARALAAAAPGGRDRRSGRAPGSAS